MRYSSGMDEELKALIREYLDLQRRTVELLERNSKRRSVGFRSWFPVIALAAFMVALFLMDYFRR